MGQNESKGVQGGVAVAPFENYQGPPLGPPPMSPPGLVTAQYNQSGGRVVALDDGQPFWDEEPPYLPQPQPLPRTARGNFGPPRGMPRRGPFGPPPDRSVVNAPGYAQQLREGMMVEAAMDAPRFHSKPPQSDQYPSGNRQPNIRTVRTVINEPRGYQPPSQQSQSYQQQSYQVQPQYQVQAQPQAQQAQQVLYYDPKTGALTSAAGHQTAAPTMPVACGTQSCAAPQVMGYQQPQVLGYQAQPQVAYQGQPQVAYQVQPQAVGYQQQPQQVMFAYPQQQAQTQPIVVPGQLFTATGGVQQLG